MGKPRMIIVVRHAQSEGNKNRDIHQYIPDHRVKLTPDGWNQAEDAGRRLRSLLEPNDTLQFFTSPYQRTRETTEGILRSLTADHDDGPSSFQRENIKVFEEPRLREQDFGNFQPCSAEMERMWQERADYGHFFYRIPNGESAADAYDRVAGFNETLWRFFQDDDFPSVCVLVTHGLMTRVFLMKWYHWSVEHFEDLRNINHCEFITMERNDENGGRFELKNNLRTWSDLKKRTALLTHTPNINTANGPPAPLAGGVPADAGAVSPTAPIRKWGGCINGCNHGQMKFPRRTKRQNTADLAALAKLEDEAQRHTASQQHGPASTDANQSSSTINGEASISDSSPATATAGFTNSDTTADPSSPTPTGPNSHFRVHNHLTDHSLHPHHHQHSRRPQNPQFILLSPGRDFGGSFSGQNSPAAFSDSASSSSVSSAGDNEHILNSPETSMRMESKKKGAEDDERRPTTSYFKAKSHTRGTNTDWAEASGMGQHSRADALGDGDGGADAVDDTVESNLTESQERVDAKDTVDAEVEEQRREEEGVLESVY